MEVEGTESGANILFVRSNESQIGVSVGIVLHHLSPEIRSTIQESIQFAVEQSKLRFEALWAVDAMFSEQALEALALSDRHPAPRTKSLDTVGLRAAGYLQEYPGRLACLVGPASKLSDMDQSNIAVELVKKLVDIGWEWSVELVQVLLEPDAPYSRFALKNGGFHKLANLIQMQLDQPFPLHAELGMSANRLGDGLIQWRQYQESDRAYWVEWLDQTYRYTRDCPELNGLRSTQSSLDGYFAASRLPRAFESQRDNVGLMAEQICDIEAASKVGRSRKESAGAVVFDADSSPHWWGGFVTANGKQSLIAGYLLNPTVPRVYELAYMGVIPSARGNKLGRNLLSGAIQTVRNLGGDRLWLAVDERNLVARSLYERFGFQEIRRLEAWIAVPPGKSLSEQI
jgi:ribosomal protein S18 acetylase RimI-like enzyme